MSEEREENLIVIDKKELGSVIENTMMGMLHSMLQPIMEPIGVMLRNNTEAVEKITGALTVMSDRMTAMERQIRLNTPIDTSQEKYLTAAMRSRARELLDKRSFADDRKAVTKLSGIIRKAVMSRYGVGNIREIPKHEYSVAMSQITMWNDALSVRDTVKEARKRAEGQNLADAAPQRVADLEQAARVDGEASFERG